jgi:DNA-binding MarR family transcriptional regulator
MEDEKIAALVAALRPTITRLIRKLRKVTPDKHHLSQSERAVLVLLDQNGSMLASELAVLEQITPQSMGTLLKHLLSLGFITKTTSETDKRKLYITISAQGKKTLQDFRKEREDWLKKAIAAVCTDKEQTLLLKAMEPLNKLIDYNN